jgi:transposase
VEAITAQGARLIYSRPPHSPDLNPVEQAFGKFKAALRRAAERTRDGLWRAIGRILERYQPQECPETSSKTPVMQFDRKPV